MKTRLLQIFIVMGVVTLSGNHWLFLQIGAWTGMVVSRSQNMGLREAVASTFDGQHPCSLCITVQKGIQHDDGTEREANGKGKLEVLWMISSQAPSPFIPPGPRQMAKWSSDLRDPGRGMDSPPKPPPRGFVA